MCHIPANGWVKYVGTDLGLGFGFIKTDNTAYPAFSLDVAKKMCFNNGFAGCIHPIYETRGTFTNNNWLDGKKLKFVWLGS